MTRSEKALFYFKNGRIREALSIFKTFRLGFSKEEKRILEIACDCLNGRSSFYAKLGIETNSVINKSKEIIQQKYSSWK